MYGFVAALRAQTALAFKEALRDHRRAGDRRPAVPAGQVDPGRVLPHAQRADRRRPAGRHRRRPAAVGTRKPRRARALAARRRAGRRDGRARRGAAARDPQGTASPRRASIHPGFDVPPPVLVYIAKTVTHNGRDLEGALNRLLAHSKLTGQPVTLEMAEREVRDLIRPQEPKRIKIEDIQRIVARQYNVSRADLLSSRRTANVVRPRQVAMYLAKTVDAAFAAGDRPALRRPRPHHGAARGPQDREPGATPTTRWPRRSRSSSGSCRSDVTADRGTCANRGPSPLAGRALALSSGIGASRRAPVNRAESARIPAARYALAKSAPSHATFVVPPQVATPGVRHEGHRRTRRRC